MRITHVHLVLAVVGVGAEVTAAVVVTVGQSLRQRGSEVLMTLIEGQGAPLVVGALSGEGVLWVVAAPSGGGAQSLVGALSGEGVHHPEQEITAQLLMREAPREPKLINLPKIRNMLMGRIIATVPGGRA